MEETRKVKCPYCGWVRNWSIKTDGYTIEILTTKGISDDLKDLWQKMKDIFTDKDIEDANAWIVMPKCPHCDKVYEYNVRTGETR